MARGPRDLIKEKVYPLREARGQRRLQAQKDLKNRPARLAATAFSSFSKTGDDLGFISPGIGIASNFVLKGKVPLKYVIVMDEVSISSDTGEEPQGKEVGEIPLEMFDTIRCTVTDMDNNPTEVFVGFLFTPTGKEGVVRPHANSNA